MNVFEGLINSIPFDLLSENGIIKIFCIIVVGFLVYIFINRNSAQNDPITSILKRRTINTDISSGVKIEDSKIAKISGKQNANVNIKIGENTKMKNSEVGIIED